MLRLSLWTRILNNQNTVRSNLNGVITLRCFSDAKSVTIGEVSKEIIPSKKPQYAPHKYLSMGELSQTTLRHLRWMLQKDLLGQDIFLIGRPGSTRRQLAMVFLEMTGREVEYICLSRDTTEADLKQRREIKNGTAVYYDQNAVRAAIEGRVLILEGVEKAERNVLPILNNLLENREMHLEDGRFLVPASRYDKLLKDHSQEELDRWNLVRVNENFRVIALGLPIPKYSGNPLDPPLRSRFQARNISHKSYEEQLALLKEIAAEVDPAKLSQLLSCSYALVSDEAMGLGLPDFPVDNVTLLGEIISKFPHMDPRSLINRLYPYRSFLTREGLGAVEETYNTFQISTRDTLPKGKVKEVVPGRNIADCSVHYGNFDAQIKVPCGSLGSGKASTSYVETNYQESLVVELLQSHLVSDFCLIGPRGCGKSATVLRLASLLNYEVEQIVLYQDITSRDLLQQRNTLPNGDTIWQNSPLIQAALQGKMAILDGIDRVHSSILSVIHRLVQDREVQLYDGKRLIRHDRYDGIKEKYNLTDEEMAASGTLRIHPSFRIVALAEPSKQGSPKGNWLTAEMISLFLFHEMRPLSGAEENKIIKSLYGKIDESMENISKLASFLRTSDDPILVSLSGSFSTRQLLRIAKRLNKYPMDNALETVHKACLARFLPPLAKEALDKALTMHDIKPKQNLSDPDVKCIVDGDQVTLGKTTVPRYITDTKTKVPDILFYDVPQHLMLMEWLLQDFTLGEHLLLVGNQGVGKNKIADRLLQLLNRPREYIQLHRDTTVQTLTLQPTVKDGVVAFEDSPLVQAVKQGHVLVVDEADKAPTHVTCILKTLVERGEMALSDGRKIVPKGHVRANEEGIIEVHPDFRMIVLANRPGFPFLGNDFFGALGDLFSSHVVDNPSPESEVALLKQYGPDVPEETILKLVKAFGELRSMSDKGLVQYPYSTREVVNIVKHLQQFPKEGLGTVVKNVFDFDEYSSSALESLIPVLQKHGIPVGAHIKNVFLSKDIQLPQREKIGNWTFNSTARTDVAAEIKNIKLSSPVHLAVKKGKADIVQSRSSKFTELTSYWSVPMAENDLILALAVTKGDDFSKDLIHVLSGNPIRLHVANTITGNMRIFTLERCIPISNYDRRYKFTITPLAPPRDNFVLLHEGNSNMFALINVADGKLHNLDLSSFTEKIAGKVKRSPSGEFKINAQISDQNIVIAYGVRQEKIMVLDLNVMSTYNIEMPFRINSLQAISDSKWLLQDIENRKFIFKKRSLQDPIPSVLVPVVENMVKDFDIGTLTGITKTDLDISTLTNLVGESISAPNRVIMSNKCYGSVIIGFPELESSENEVYSWFRRDKERGLKGKSIFLKEINQIVTPVSTATPPEDVTVSPGGLSGFLEVVDLKKGTLRYIRVPKSNDRRWYIDSFELGLFAAETSNSGLVTVDRQGCLQFWEVGEIQLKRSLDEWMKMVGSDRENLQLTIEKDSGKEVSSPKHGKVDPKNEPHVGGNTWAGGTGGRDTAGLGGKGGPYRLDAGHDVHQISDYEKSQVPEEVRAAAREMNRRVYKQRLNEIRMSEYDDNLYQSFSGAVAKQVEALRVVISNVQAKSKEREWARHQTSGDLDDLKLIEGLTGEKTIYRRRTEKEPDPGTPLTKPKRLKLIVDVSASMYRFNGYDKRLQRVMEASVMVMEAFHGHENQFKYDIIGHSGETYNLEFVSADAPPKNNKERLEVVKLMYAHSQFCLSGDHTLPATVHAIEKISKEDCDEAIVVVLSDANLDHYNISAHRFGRILTSNPDVNGFAIFIGSLGNQAAKLAQSLPAGRAFVCLDLSQIPQILQQIFSYSLLYKSQ